MNDFSTNKPKADIYIFNLKLQQHPPQTDVLPHSLFFILAC